MDSAASWIAPVATTLAAVMVALHAGSRITGFGFIVFSVGSVAWAWVGWSSDQMNLFWQNIVLLTINLVGVWRCFGAHYAQIRAT